MKSAYAATLLLLLGLSASANAQHKFFPTDGLDSGQQEYNFSFMSSRYSQDLVDAVVAMKSTGSVQVNTLAASFGYGVGGGLEYVVAVPMVLDATATTTSYSPAGTTVRQSSTSGLGDMIFGARYLAAREDSAGYDLMLAGFVKPRTARPGRPGSGTTDVMPGLSVSKHTSPNARHYLGYAYVLTEKEAPNSHFLSAGSEFKLAAGVWLAPAVQWTRFNNSGRAPAHASTQVSLAAVFAMGNGVFLSPELSLGRTNGYQLGTAAVGPTRADRIFSLTLQFLR